MGDVMVQLSQSLEGTLSANPEVRRKAEKFLASVEINANYSLVLLQLVASDQTNMNVRIAAAITFKNFVKHNWHMVDGVPNKISEQDRVTVKQHIVDLMLSMPTKLQRQLSEAVSLIGRSDFPDKWPELLPNLVAKLSTDNFDVINGVMQTANSLFKRYTYEFKSDGLFVEIKIALDAFAAPLTQITNQLVGTLPQQKDKKVLEQLFTLLEEAMSIFYSLNYQDLPEYFEDNMDLWMGIFHTLLTYDNAEIRSDDPEKPGPLERTKAQVCENIALYAKKYNEEEVEFAKHLPMFVQDIWGLLVTTSDERCNDYLVSGGINFLRTLAERPSTAQLFGTEGTLSSICQKVIIPNMQLREADVEQFEDDPEEYIRADIEGSDADTRRRAVCELIKELRKYFKKEVTEIFTPYVDALMQEYTANPAAKWPSKDAAIYLVTSLTVEGSVQALGTTKINEFVNVVDFYNKYILPDLQNADVNAVPVLKASGIKYLVTFRNQLPKELLVQSLPFIVAHIVATSVVVHSYAANALDKLLATRIHPDVRNSPYKITEIDMQPYLNQALANLITALNYPQSRENHYIMKAIMRMIIVGKSSIMPVIDQLMTLLTAKIAEVSKNPSKPDFNHYLFESVGAAVKYVCETNKAAVVPFEQALFPLFTEILQNDVAEFMPYVFQIMSQLLELHDPPAPPAYQELFPHLLAPPLWEKLGNIPALTRLLQAFISKTGPSIGTNAETMMALLGVFQKVVISKSNDHHAFYLLDSIVEFVPKSSVDLYLKDIYIVLFQRLQQAKTTKFVKSLIVFTSLVMGLHGPDYVIATVDSIQPRLFAMVVQSLYLADLQKVSGHLERKICAVGATRCLTESPKMLSDYKDLWSKLLNSLVGLFELPEQEDEGDEGFIDVESPAGYQNAFSRLAFSGGVNRHDPFAAIPDVKVLLATGLKNLSATTPDLVALIGQCEPGAQQHIQAYFQAAGLAL